MQQDSYGVITEIRVVSLLHVNININRAMWWYNVYKIRKELQLFLYTHTENHTSKLDIYIHVNIRNINFDYYINLPYLSPYINLIQCTCSAVTLSNG